VTRRRKSKRRNHANAGRYPRAAEKAQALLTSTTDNHERVKLFRVLTKSMFEMERKQKAVEFALDGLKLDPNNPVLLNSLHLPTFTAIRQKKPSRAFATALRLMPRCNCRNTEGVIWIRLGRYDKHKRQSNGSKISADNRKSDESSIPASTFWQRKKIAAML